MTIINQYQYNAVRHVLSTMRTATLDIFGQLNLEFAGPASHYQSPGLQPQSPPMWSHTSVQSPHQRQRDLPKIQV